MIAKDKVVSIDYSVTDENDQLIDTSEGREPLTYLHGAANIIPGLETALEGKQEGEDFEVTVVPEQAYGVRNEDNVQQVPISSFPEPDQVKVGMTFTAKGQNGNFQVQITAIDEDKVTVDANHPLADKTLTFKGAIRSIRDATDEEIAHGHAH